MRKVWNVEPLDSQKIEDYIRLFSSRGDLDLIPKGSNDIKVSNVRRISLFSTNDLNSFELAYSCAGLEQRHPLILKRYVEPMAMACGHDEDLRRYVREFEALQGLWNAGFSVPKAYLCECDSFFLGYPFIIMRDEGATNNKIDVHGLFAVTLAKLHNLNVVDLGINALRIPKGNNTYVKELLSRYKCRLETTRHNGALKKSFDLAMNWLNLKVSNYGCPRYSIIHGDYSPGNTLVTKDSRIIITDWESVEVGDPAFDVAYAYHAIRLSYDYKNPSIAESFVSEYLKNYNSEIQDRLEFYKVLALIDLAIEFSNLISNPLEAYRCFGYKTLISFPFLRVPFVAEKCFGTDFILRYLRYFEEFIGQTLK